MSRIFQITPVPPEGYPAVVALWEASVRATHHFLAEKDILYYRSCLARDLLPLVNLFGIYEEDALAAFIGCDAGKAEMLFVRPDRARQGLGRALMHYAIGQLGVDAVDVNEQNPEAAAFYRKLGFEQTGRSAIDGSGKPYPILHLKLPPHSAVREA